MVIDNLNIMGVSRTPAEAYPPLSVDSDTMLPRTVTLELLEPICRRYAQIVEGRGGVKHPQLSEPHFLNVRPELLDGLASEEALGVAAPKALDHPL